MIVFPVNYKTNQTFQNKIKTRIVTIGYDYSYQITFMNNLEDKKKGFSKTLAKIFSNS